MKKENQLCSLELAKKLKELGVEQESYFYWVEADGFIDPKYIPNDLTTDFVLVPKEDCQIKTFNEEGVEYYSAFTVAELGEMLPEELHSFKLPDEFCCESNQSDYFPKGKNSLFFTADTEANARAKMLIYLLENKLI